MPVTILARVDPVGGRVEARTDAGHALGMIGEATPGESDGFTPKQALLASLAGCTSMDVVSILRKKRQPPDAYEVRVNAESGTEHPRVFLSIEVEHRVSGAVTPEALRRSIELSATSYCPVSAMLSASTTIEHRYRLTDADGAQTKALVAVTGPTGSRVL